MKKLTIIYKTEDIFNSEKTDYIISFVTPTAELCIGTKETRKLGEIVKKLEEHMRKSTWLEENEELKLSDFDKYFIDYEQETKNRKDVYTYNLCKMAYKAVEEGKTTWEYIINLHKEGRCSECM